MNIEGAFIILFSVASAVAIASRRFRVPYTVALVLAGLAIGSLHIIEPPGLTKELLFAVFLPGLLFEAAFHLEFSDFQRNWKAITSLALPGVIAAVGLTALLVVVALAGLGIDEGFTGMFGLVFGGLIAATDPVAVTALFRQLHVPRRLSVLVEGESLLNDGTSVVFLTLILAFVAGTSPSTGSLVQQFIIVVGGGALIGGVLGFVISQVIRGVDEAMIEITLTTIAAYGSFALAEQLHQSGVIATVVAGMICGSYGRPSGMSPTTRLAVESFWEYLAFALNSVVFLLIGFEVPIGSLVKYLPEILIAYVAVIAARAGVVSLVVMLMRRTRERIPTKWIAVITWGGLRGALSMVLALALPFDFPHREQLVTMTVGVVLLSLVVQGMTMAPLLRRLGIIFDQPEQLAYGEVRTRLQLAQAGINAVEVMELERSVSRDLLHTLRDSYAQQFRDAEGEMARLLKGNEALQRLEADHVERRMINIEIDRLREAHRAGGIMADGFERLMSSLTARLERIEEAENSDLAPPVKVPPAA